jgi:aminoglycoside 6'-N-acetyltransferase I
MTVRVRQVQRKDAEQWLEMRRALWPDEGTGSHADEVRSFFDRPRVLGEMPEAVLIAFDPDGRALGFVELSRRPYAEGCETSPVGYLEGWYVVPDARRTGVGRALVEASLDWARSVGCREFASDALVDNDVSTKAHLAVGFEEVEVIRTFRTFLGGDGGSSSA